jgi:hypothetical protein
MVAKKKPTKKTTKKLAKVEEQALAPVLEDMFADAGAGFEEADQEAYSIPYLNILQSNSPQCDDEIIQGRPGMFFNTATQELYDGKEGVLFIPCMMQRRFVEWRPREQGGGFVGAHLPEDIDTTQMARDGGKFITSSGTYLMDTRYHYGLVLKGDGDFEAVVLPLSSTQLKASRNWMTGMRGQKAVNPKTGQRMPLPMFAQVWRLSSVAQSNDKGSWKGLATVFERLIAGDEADIYAAAKDFKEQVSTGAAQAQAPVEESDDVPF